MPSEQKNPNEGLSDAEKVKVNEDAKRKALEAVKQKIVIVDASHLAEMEARDAADAHMTEDKGKAGFWKKLWKHTFFDEYYRQKELNKVRNDIMQSGNIYNAVEKDKKAHDNAMSAIATRFSSEYDEAINTKAGESKEELKDGNNTTKTKDDIKALIISYAQGNITEGVFNTEKNRIFNTIDHASLKGASNYADNLFEIAKNAKLAINHGAKLEELDLDLNVVVGKAKSSIKTEAHDNWVDKAVSGIKKTAVGRFINPATLSTALGLVYSVGAGTGKMLLKNKVSHAVTFGGTAVVSGLLSAANESQRLSSERRQHGREMAKGGSIGEGSERRESMEKYAYQTENANTLIDNLKNSLFTTDKDGKLTPKEINEAELAGILGQIGNIEARNSLADEKKIDLISYSNPTNVEKERTELTILLARSKVELRKQLETNMKGSTLTSAEKMNEYIEQQVDIAEKSFLGGEKGITSRDKAFSNLKFRRSALKMGKTILMGVTIGAATQEVIAGVDGLWGGHREGIIEGLLHHGGETSNHVQTPLEHIRGMLTGHSSHLSMENAHEQLLGNNHFKLPEGAEIIKNGDGTFNIVNGDHVISNHIELNTDASGALDQATLDRLGEDGVVAGTVTNVVDGTNEVVKSAHDYMNDHLDKTTHIARSWMGNDTPMYPDPNHPGHLLGADQNELRTQWAGVKGSGIDANGDYVLNVQHMTNDGSFQDGVSVAAHDEMAKGKLEVLFSVTKDTQTHVIKGIIDSHGLIHISHDSEVGKMLFENVNGHAQYNGAFLEIAKHDMDLPDGREHMQVLGTHIGTNNPHDITDIIHTHEEIVSNTLELPLDTEPPYFIPLVPRTPLEPIFYKPPFNPNDPADRKKRDITQTYYNGASLGQIQKEFKDRGLDSDPYTLVELADGRKIWVDKNNKEVSRDKVRERARLISYLEKQSKEYLEELKSFNENLEPMSKDCRVSVIIPARFEEKNLANLLDQYVKQVDEKGKPINKDLFEINIIINRREGEKADKSIEVIKEWKDSNPGYHVNAIDKVFSKENANVGMARKYITDLSLMRSTEREDSSGPLYIESEDADLVSVDKRTIAKLIKGFDEKPHLDVLRGIQDRQPEVMSQNDLFFFERRMWDISEIVMRDESLRSDKFNQSSFTWNRVISGGWNTAYTAESYAQIGGYVPDLMGEDMKIGQKISVLRGKADGDDKYKFNTYTAEASGLRANSSPRRFLDAMAKQVNPYDDFDDQSIKEKTLDELLENLKQFKSISPEHRSRYEASINVLYRFIRNEMGENEESKKVMIRSLSFMGLKRGDNFDYVIGENNEIKMTDKGFEKTGGLLTKYKEEEKWKLGYKRQNSPVNNVTEKKEKVKTKTKSKKAEPKPKATKVPKTVKKADTIKVPVDTTGLSLEMNKLRDDLREAEQQRNESEVLRLEDEIRKLEKVEKGERKINKFEINQKDLKEELVETFKKILIENGDRAKLTNLDLEIKDNKIFTKASLDAGRLGGKPTIDMNLEVVDGKIVFYGNPVIKANRLASSTVNGAAMEIPGKIKEVLGANRNGKVSKISIDGDKLNIEV